MYKQDLHVHTVYSTGDSAIVPQQRVEFIARLNYAEIRGISDHFEYLTEDSVFDDYQSKLHSLGFYCGCEVNDSVDAEKAVDYPFDYYIYHCRDKDSEYRGAEKLLSTGKPLIISHPMAMGCDLNRLSSDCYIEINNRYVWKQDYMAYYPPHLNRFRFVLGSDAHQPNWLNLMIAEEAAEQLGVDNSLIFKAPYPANGKN